MVHDDKFPIAAQLFIRLKRNPGRVIDVTWMLENELYALEVLKVARLADAESADLAARYESMLRSRRGNAPAQQQPAAFARTSSFLAEPETVVDPEVGRHYVGSLR